MLRTFHVDKDERALVFRGGKLVEVLRAGEHRVFDPLRRLELARFSCGRATLEPRLVARLANADPALVQREFHDVRLGATEVGLRYERGSLVEVLAPATRCLLLGAPGESRVARFDIARRFALPYSLTQLFASAAVRAGIAGAQHVLVADVPSGSTARLVVDGAEQTVLRAGQHAFFTFGRTLRVEP